MMAGNSAECPVFMHTAAQRPVSALSISIQTLHHSPSRVVARQLEQAFCARSLHANVIADGFMKNGPPPNPCGSIFQTFQIFINPLL